jgi:hypothetical protein
MKPGETKEIQDYEVKEAAECLLKAEEIKANKSLMEKVHEHMEGKKKHIMSVADLRKKADEIAEASEESEAPMPKAKAKKA